MTQNYEARECVIATPSSGVGNLGMQGHDACWLSLAVAGYPLGMQGHDATCPKLDQ